MNPTLQLITFVGGIALLVYGMRVVGNGLQQAAGARLRTWLHRFTVNRFRGAALGTAVTALMQSSSATAVLLVSLAAASLLTLEQSIGVMLGAGVGSTLTVHLIAFNILEWAPLMIAVGVTLLLTMRHRAYTNAGRAIFGFGLIFQGLQLIVVGTASLGQNSVFADLVADLTGAPIVLLLIGVGLTAVVQTSAATLGIAVGLALNGAIGLDTALPLVLGANIGTTATALLASLGGAAEGPRVAAAQVALKLAGAIVAFPLIGAVTPLIAWSAPDLPRQIANAHTFFNLAMLVVLLPLVTPFAWLVRTIVPEPRRTEPRAEDYLDPATLASPTVAIGQATRAILRMAELVQTMVRDVISAMDSGDESLVIEVRERDDQVDALQRSIRHYLTTLAADPELQAETSAREIGLLYVINDLENIGDIVDKNLAELALKKLHGRHEFSADGMADLRQFDRRVAEQFDRAISAFAASDKRLAGEVIAQKDALSELEREMRMRHIRRLYEGRTETIDTSDIHLDVLSNLKRINTHATNLAYVVTGQF